MKPAKHPRQPVVLDRHGVARFKENAIVRFLLDEGPFDLTRLAMRHFSDEDRTQFAQLIGYSVSGAGDLDYFNRRTLAAADRETARLLEKTK